MDGLGDDELDQLVETFAKAAEDYGATFLRPLTVPVVAEGMRAMADMLGCPVPGKLGIDLFVAAIADLPALLFERAQLRVAQTHKFMRMPLPADYLKAVEAETAFIRGQHAMLAAISERARHARAARAHRRRRFNEGE